MMNRIPNPPTGEQDEAEGVVPCFKDDQGRFRTQSLFWETRHPKYSPIFTTKREDHEGCISMYQKYMEIADPTEYQVAIQLLGSWPHWKMLVSTKWFSELLTEWREELRTKIDSENYNNMRETARDFKGQPNGIQATKWLDGKYGTPPEKRKRGRPSNAEIQKNLKAQTEELDYLNDDAKLVGIK